LALKTRVIATFFFIEVMPFTTDFLVLYGSLVRMIWPLLALRLNLNLPLGLFF
jgi:hypothetical protein